SEVRRCAARAESAGGHTWYEAIPTGSLEARWATACAEGGPLHKIRNSAWVKRRSAREQRDEVLRVIEVEVIEAVEATLAQAADGASEDMVAALTHGDESPGRWLAGLRDPRDARVMR